MPQVHAGTSIQASKVMHKNVMLAGIWHTCIDGCMTGSQSALQHNLQVLISKRRRICPAVGSQAHVRLYSHVWGKMTLEEPAISSACQVSTSLPVPDVLQCALEALHKHMEAGGEPFRQNPPCSRGPYARGACHQLQVLCIYISMSAVCNLA